MWTVLSFLSSLKFGSTNLADLCSALSSDKLTMAIQLSQYYHSGIVIVFLGPIQGSI